MFDETGSDYQPLSAPKAVPPTEIPASRPASLPPVPPPSLKAVQTRPFWLRITGYILMLVLMQRFCTLGSSEHVLTIVVQFASLAVLAITVLGVLGMRRWAVWMLLFYCAWAIISGIIVAIVRISYVGEVIPGNADGEWIIFLQIVYLIVGILFYSALGIWYSLNLKLFIPLPFAPKYGNIPFVIMIGVLLLFTATQIAEAREYVKLQGEIVQESRDFSQQFFGQ